MTNLRGAIAVGAIAAVLYTGAVFVAGLSLGLEIEGRQTDAVIERTTALLDDYVTVCEVTQAHTLAVDAELHDDLRERPTGWRVDDR